MLTVPLPGGQNWYVDVQDPDCATGMGGPLDPFCDIASALQVAANGDTIFIAPGTYPETLLVEIDVALIGTGGAAATFVDGNQQGTVLQVTAGVTASVDGLTLTDGLDLFGGGVRNSGSLTFTNSTVSASVATLDGGGIVNSGELTLTDCSITGNVAHGYHGGGVFNRTSGSANLTRCLVSGNESSYYYGGGIRNDGSMSISDSIITGNYTAHDGGGIYNSGTLSMTYSAVVDNGCGLNGAGIFNDGPTVLVNCTIAGNEAFCAAGGLWNATTASCTASHTIVAGNVGPCVGPDVLGTLESLGHDVLGDSSGAVLTGDLTGNLLDVDPGFANPAGGDYRLAPTSVAVDAGSALRTDHCLLDLSGNLRILDGDLDGSAILDPGAHEFAHVRLDVQGSATPGGTLTLNGSGTPGLPTFLWIGFASAQLVFPPYGCLFVDVTLPKFLLPLGGLPIPTLVGTLPPDVPLGTVLVFQLHSVTAGAGNLSNPAVLTIQ